MNAIQVFGLNAAQVGFLKNMIQECDRRKIFSKDWKRLNVLWCIYYSQDMENLEKNAEYNPEKPGYLSVSDAS